MRIALSSILVVCVLELAGCAGRDPVRDFDSSVVTLPGGQKITAEVMRNDADMMRGMMFRDSIEPDRGMLFVHQRPGAYTYWMYQVKIPLDIIWLDTNRRILEISANTPPCKSTSARECPHYGGSSPEARYVLELGGGMAAKYGLGVGQQLDF
jgi:uncharacterized membrane protein (UPF0127 family)